MVVVFSGGVVDVDVDVDVNVVVVVGVVGVVGDGNGNLAIVVGNCAVLPLMLLFASARCHNIQAGRVLLDTAICNKMLAGLIIT